MKIVIFDNIPTQYRDELFQSISDESEVTELDVYYNDQNEADRKEIHIDAKINRHFRRGILLSRSGRQIKHNIRLIFPPVSSIIRSNKIIVTGYNLPIYWLIALFSYIWKKKLIFFWEITSPRDNAIKILFLRALSSCASSILVPTLAAENYLNSIGISNTRIVHNGVKLRDYKHGAIDKRSCDFIFVNRLSKEKGIERLIEFLTELDRCGESHNIAIIGDGPKRPQLELACAKFTNIKVVLHGWLERDLTLDAIRDAKTLLSFSHFEAWGFSVTEALSLGCDVLATREVSSAAEYSRHFPNAVKILESDYDICEVLEWRRHSEQAPKEFFDVRKQTLEFLRQ